MPGCRRVLHQHGQHGCAGRGASVVFCSGTAVLSLTQHRLGTLRISATADMPGGEARRPRSRHTAHPASPSARWQSSTEEQPRTSLRVGVHHTSARRVLHFTVQTPATLTVLTWRFLFNPEITWSYRRYRITQRRSSKAGFMTRNTRQRLSKGSTELILVSSSMDTSLQKAIPCTTWQKAVCACSSFQDDDLIPCADVAWNRVLLLCLQKSGRDVRGRRQGLTTQHCGSNMVRDTGLITPM